MALNTPSLQPSSSHSRRNKLIAAGAVVVIACGAFGYKAWSGRAKTDPFASNMKVTITGADGKPLSKEMQAKIDNGTIKTMRVGADGTIPPEQLAEMKKQAEAHRSAMLKGYFDLPAGPARKAYLDKQIDQQAAVEAEIKQLTDGKGAGGSGSPPNGVRVMVKAGGGGQKGAAEGVPAEVQAEMAQYMRDMNDRRAERGLPPQQGMRIINITKPG